MAEMTSRERILTAINHQEPDRVPVALGGGPYGVVDELYYKLLDLFEIGEPTTPFRTGHTISYLDDRLFEQLGIDTRYIWPGSSPSSPAAPTGDPDIFLDGYGQPWKRALPYYYATEGILAEATINQIDEIVNWPDPSEPRWTAGVSARARMLRESTDYFIVARMVTSHGPYMTACDLRGTEKLLLDMALDKQFAKAIMDRVTNNIDELLRVYLQACGDYIDMIELPGDDYASNVNLIISPKMFREFVKPALQRLVTTIKEYREDIKVMLHSDGLIEKILPEFVDIGIDVVHPMEPVPAMNQAKVKQEFGDKLAFLGTIDISHAMPGSQTDVIEEVKVRIKQFAQGGGYVLAPSNHLQADVPPENVVTLFNAARKYGQYPIDIPD
jgi:uroporphyrinogen decarboxylase